MINGLFRVEFRTPLGHGAGVIVLQDGVLRGGDSSMFYAGTYAELNGKFSATVHAGKHTNIPGVSSVFGVDSLHISLSGTANGDAATAQGTAAEAPGVAFQAALSRIN